MPLQEIIDWLGQKDEELSAQLPLRGDVLLVQQEKETHAVRSLVPPLPPLTAKRSCRWQPCLGPPPRVTAPAHSPRAHLSLPVSISAPRGKAEPQSHSKHPWHATGGAHLVLDNKCALQPAGAAAGSGPHHFSPSFLLMSYLCNRGNCLSRASALGILGPEEVGWSRDDLVVRT